MKNRGWVKEHLGRAFAQMKQGLSADLYAIREKFTLRSFLALFFGALLLAACWFFYVAPLVYAFCNVPWYQTLPQFFFGLIGFLCSNYLIFAVSLHTAAGNVPKASDGSHSLVSDALTDTGPSRRKKIAVAVCLYVAIWAAGLTALGFVIRDNVRAKEFEEVPATVEMIFPHGEGYTLRYGYDLGGEHYTYTGHSKFSGVAAPQVGDIILIKVDCANPGRIYVPNESPALVFAVFLLATGLFLILYELYARGKFPLPFALTVAMWLIPATLCAALFASQDAAGAFSLLARNQSIQIVLLFVYGGALELVCGVLSLGNKRVRKKERGHVR